jgi:hypothetical protein
MPAREKVFSSTIDGNVYATERAGAASVMRILTGST